MSNLFMLCVKAYCIIWYADNGCNMHSVEVQLTASRQFIVYKASCEFSASILQMRRMREAYARRALNTRAQIAITSVKPENYREA